MRLLKKIIASIKEKKPFLEKKKIKKEKKYICETGFESLRELLDYLTANKIKYKLELDNNNIWVVRVGAFKQPTPYEPETITNDL